MRKESGLGGRGDVGAAGHERRETSPGSGRRQFLRLAALGAGSTAMSTVAACKTATTQNAGGEHDTHAENASDYIAPGVLAVRRSVGAVDSGLRRSPYSFKVSASYN